MASELRVKRTASIIRDLVSQMIMSDRIKDRSINRFVSIVRVEPSRDLTSADVYVSSCDPRANMDKILEGFGRSSKFIQSQVGRALKSRVTPELRFKVDKGAEELEKIDALIAEIHRQEAALASSSDSIDEDSLDA